MWFRHFTLAITIITFLGQLFVLYLNWKMIKFTSIYSKQWKRAFIVFFTGMWAILARRIIIMLWGLGIDGRFGHAIQWIDHVVIGVVGSIVYIIFLCMLFRWWTKFFNQYMSVQPSEKECTLVVDEPAKVKMAIVKEKDKEHK